MIDKFKKELMAENEKATPHTSNQPSDTSTQPMVQKTTIPDSIKGSDRYTVYPDLPSANLANDPMGGAASPQTAQDSSGNAKAVSNQRSVQAPSSESTEKT
jgi:hypothetical protein